MKLLSKKDNNLFKLLNILYLNSRLPISSILSDIDISSSNLTLLITDLNEIIYPCQVTKEYGDLILNVPNHSSYDCCVSKLLSQSLEYSIAESLFFETNDTYISLAESLFVSESTIKRTIKKLNDYFYNYDVIITTKPLRIIGNEKNIRYLFIAFFAHKYNLTNLPFTKEIIERLATIYKVGRIIFRRNKNIQDCLNFILFSGIAYEREKNFHSLDLQDSKKKNFLIDILNKLPKRITKISSKNEMKLWINTLSLFTNHETLNIHSFSLKTRELLFQEKKITEFLFLICEIFNISLSKKEKDELSIEIYEILYGFLKTRETDFLENNFYEIFYKKNDFFINSFKELVKDIFYYCFSENLHEHFYFCFFVLTTNFPNLLNIFFMQFSKANLIIYIDFDYKFSEYIKNKLLKNIAGNPNIICIRLLSELQNKTTQNKTDLFITNVYDYEITGYITEKTHVVSHHLSTLDIQNITDKVLGIYQKNYEHLIQKGEKLLKLYKQGKLDLL